MMKKGIACAGNWIVDHYKNIDVYPQKGTLANILSETSGGGGCAYNVIINLARFDGELPLYAYGAIGEDKDGEQILEECSLYPNIDTSSLFTTNERKTSYTDVYTIQDSGERTFFHYRGANSLFSTDHIRIENICADIFHFGYLLLLDKMDEAVEEFGSRAAELLCKVKDQRIKTSIDVVSEDSDRFQKIVPPALKHTDYCIINDFEAEKVTGIPIRANNRVRKSHLRKIAEKIYDFGVHELVVIHFPEGAFLLSRDGTEIIHPSLDLPDDYIVGTTGAGDSFCSGILYGLYHQWGYERTLHFAFCSAAMNLSHITATGSIGDVDSVLNVGEQFSYRMSV